MSKVEGKVPAGVASSRANPASAYLRLWREHEESNVRNLFDGLYVLARETGCHAGAMARAGECYGTRS